MTEPTIQLSQVANVRQQFERHGFNFTEGGTYQDKPRYFGVVRGCTLEIVGEAAISHVTMVAMMAPDDVGTARLNGFRMAALMALLAGEAGVKWSGWAMKEAGKQPGRRAAIEDALGGWRLTMIVNRQKSAVTLKVKGMQS